MSIKDRLSTLWIIVMFNMAFADILGFIDLALPPKNWTILN